MRIHGTADTAAHVQVGADAVTTTSAIAPSEPNCPSWGSTTNVQVGVDRWDWDRARRLFHRVGLARDREGSAAAVGRVVRLDLHGDDAGPLTGRADHYRDPRRLADRRPGAAALRCDRDLDPAPAGRHRAFQPIEREHARCRALGDLDPDSVDHHRAPALDDLGVGGRREADGAVALARRARQRQPVGLAASLPGAFAVGGDDDGAGPAGGCHAGRLGGGVDSATRTRGSDRCRGLPSTRPRQGRQGR